MHSPEVSSTGMSRSRHLQKCFPELASEIANVKVLMVGAGGIGCELLKNLVLTGFGEVHLLDLDTIDLSNLNRQFLFQKQHIKKSKALVAKETAQKFNPKVKLHAYHANIKDENYNVLWFKQFRIVFNALDNLEARRHVNKMCLAAEVPLVESGTTGFRGQVQVIVKGKTECYDCNPKEIPKSFPICTIRSTPSQPIHCIVWAKSYLFSQVFGLDEDDETLDQTVDGGNREELINLQKEANALKEIKEAMGTSDFARRIFNKVYKKDIIRLLSAESMWTARKAPTPLDYDELDASASSTPSALSEKDQVLWSLEENLRVFQDSLERLSKRMQELKNASNTDAVQPTISFDKDDQDTLDFVAAAANIRAHIFDIDRKTKFEIKQMAGNIIAAIATTNAIIAGVCVLQSFKILQDDLASTKTIFLSRRPERVFNNESTAKPLPECSVCGVVQILLECDTARMTLKELVDKVLLQSLGYSEEISIISKDLVYDPDFDDNLEKTLQHLSIKNGTFLTVVDDDENEDGLSRVNLQICVHHSDLSTKETFKQVDMIDIPFLPKKVPLPDLDHIVPIPPSANGTGDKRKRAAEDDDDDDAIDASIPRKKRTDTHGREIMEIVDGDEIVID